MDGIVNQQLIEAGRPGRFASVSNLIQIASNDLISCRVRNVRKCRRQGGEPG